MSRQSELLLALRAEIEAGAIEIKPFYVNDGKILIHVWTTGNDIHGFDYAAEYACD